MFELTARLRADIEALLLTLLELGEGGYACVMDPARTHFEVAAEAEAACGLRLFLGTRRAALFAIPSGLAGEGPIEDVFESWEGGEFLLAFLNGRVAVVVACRDAGALKQAATEPLGALADRLLRFEPTWRVDERGRGLFFGRARLDIVTIGGDRG